MLIVYRHKSTCHQLSQAVTSPLKGSDRESAKVGFSSQGGLHREATRECGSSRRVGEGHLFCRFPPLQPSSGLNVSLPAPPDRPVSYPCGATPAPLLHPGHLDYPAAPSTRLGVGFLLIPTTVLAEVRPAMKSVHPFSTTLQRNLPHETKGLPQGPSRKPA